MTGEQRAADAAAVALRKYREALARFGWAGSDGWLIAYLKVQTTRPDAELAAVCRALVWARDERGGRPAGKERRT